MVKRADSDSRIGIFELLINTTAIKNNLKKMDLSQIDSTIESSTAQGMISMAQYARKLVDKGLIHQKDVEWLFKRSQEG